MKTKVKTLSKKPVDDIKWAKGRVQDKPLVAILMGSESDKPIMSGAEDVLKKLDVPFETHVISAHRLPENLSEYLSKISTRRIEVIIAGAGMAAHLPGVIASKVTVPVIGVPLKSGALNGVDALYSIVQMPSGVPVATVAIDGAKNAAFLAAQILGLKYSKISQNLQKLKKHEQKRLEDLLRF
jgi:5-(carboxyamino)imidazole ribonucleotide mutase